MRLHIVENVGKTSFEYFNIVKFKIKGSFSIKKMKG